MSKRWMMENLILHFKSNPQSIFCFGRINALETMEELIQHYVYVPMKQCLDF